MHNFTDAQVCRRTPTSAMLRCSAARLSPARQDSMLKPPADHTCTSRISPSKAARNEDFPQPTAPTTTSSSPGRTCSVQTAVSTESKVAELGRNSRLPPTPGTMVASQQSLPSGQMHTDALCAAAQAHERSTCRSTSCSVGAGSSPSLSSPSHAKVASRTTMAGSSASAAGSCGGCLTSSSCNACRQPLRTPLGQEPLTNSLAAR